MNKQQNKVIMVDTSASSQLETRIMSLLCTAPWKLLALSDIGWLVQLAEAQRIGTGSAAAHAAPHSKARWSAAWQRWTLG